MVKIAICDDDPVFIPLLRKEVEKSMSEHQQSVTFEEFESGRQLLDSEEKESISLLFLDIDMPGIDGFQLAKMLKEMLPEMYIAFVSGYDDFVFCSYEYEPLWFVRKREISQAIPYVIRKFLKKTQYDNLKCQYRAESNLFTVYAKDIIYIEGSLHTLKIHTIDREFKVYGSLRQEEERLGEAAFIRPYRNYLVNVRYIDRIEQKTILLKNGERIPVSKDQKKVVTDKMLEVF